MSSFFGALLRCAPMNPTWNKDPIKRNPTNNEFVPQILVENGAANSFVSVSYGFFVPAEFKNLVIFFLYATGDVW